MHLLFSLTMSQVLLCRNSEGEIDPEGKIWSAPYRWGCVVIAYNKVQFRRHNLAPMEVLTMSRLLLSYIAVFVWSFVCFMYTSITHSV